jgi:hypothetical protein
MSDPMVTVTRQRGDSPKMAIPETALSGFHLAHSTGVLGAPLPGAALAAYMSATEIPEAAELGDDGAHRPRPRRIKVLIQKVDNDTTVYKRLRAVAVVAAARR